VGQFCVCGRSARKLHLIALAPRHSRRCRRQLVRPRYAQRWFSIDTYLYCLNFWIETKGDDYCNILLDEISLIGAVAATSMWPSFHFHLVFWNRHQIPLNSMSHFVIVHFSCKVGGTVRIFVFNFAECLFARQPMATKMLQFDVEANTGPQKDVHEKSIQRLKFMGWKMWRIGEDRMGPFITNRQAYALKRFCLLWVPSNAPCPILVARGKV